MKQGIQIQHNRHKLNQKIFILHRNIVYTKQCVLNLCFNFLILTLPTDKQIKFCYVDNYNLRYFKRYVGQQMFL